MHVSRLRCWVSFIIACICLVESKSIFQPPHDKTNKMTVPPAKTQISLGIRPVWSESSLSAWRKLGSLATHWVHSKDSDKSGRMPRLIWVFAGCTCHFVGFVTKRLISKSSSSYSLRVHFVLARIYLDHVFVQFTALFLWLYLIKVQINTHIWASSWETVFGVSTRWDSNLSAL